MSACRFCGCEIDDASATAETASGVAHQSCIEPDPHAQDGTIAKRKRFLDAVLRLHFASRVNGQ